jgi:transposase
LAALLEWVEAEPDITMPELEAKLEAEKAVTAHPASLSRVLLKAGLSFKKTLRASEAGREDVRQARDEWKGLRQPRACARRSTGWSSSMKPERRPR